MFSTTRQGLEGSHGFLLPGKIKIKLRAHLHLFIPPTIPTKLNKMKQNSKFFVTDFAPKRSVLSLTPCPDSYFSLEYRKTQEKHVLATVSS